MSRASRRSLLAISIAVSAFAVAELSATPAGAHGAFPQSVSFREDPSDPTRFWVGTSFGLATSTDSGRTWSWLCEEAPDYEGFEPDLALTADGSIVVSSSRGVSVSHDNGCSWGHPTNTPEKMVSDVYVEDAAGVSVIALFSTSSDAAFVNQIWSSADNARTWTQVGGDIAPELLLSTVRSAPSDLDTMYITGKRFDEDWVAEAVALRTRNRGETWEELPEPQGDTLRVVAVHPEHPGTVYLRAQDDGEEALDTLWVSDDFGESWKEAHRGKARLYGFAFSPDLSEIWLGLGDPRDVSIDDGAQGIWVGDTETFGFERVQDGPIGCLTSTDTGLFVCTRQFFHRFELARVDQPGDPLEGLWELDKLTGVAECGVDTDVSKLCHAKWPETCFLTSQCGGDAGSGGSGGSAGETGAGGIGATDPDPGPGPGPGSCACRVDGEGSGSRGATPAGLALLGLLGAWVARRRRR